MTEYELKYGLNPNQKPAAVFMRNGGELPFEILNGRPGYINFMDALNAWRLVRELRETLNLPAAASFKHVSPAGAAVAVPLTDELRKMYYAGGELSPLAEAYARARGADRLCSYGDFCALSDVCDEFTARLIAPEVSDGVIAPGYTKEALEILKAKRRGSYVILRMDPDYSFEGAETRDIYGVSFRQPVNAARLGPELLENIVTARKDVPPDAVRDLIVSLVTLKYTQSNSVCFTADGQAIGVGAGQQSRVHCVRLAADKADNWRLRRHGKILGLPWREGISRPARDNAIDVLLSDEPETLTAAGKWEALFTREPEILNAREKMEWIRSGPTVSLGSDAFFPFEDSVERAERSNAGFIAQPGGSVRDEAVIEAADRYGMAMAFTGIRLFHH